MKNTDRKNTSERKTEIVEAVLKIIGQKGFTAVSTKTISEEIGVSSGAIFRHFSSLDEIYKEVTNYAVSQIDKTFPDESLSPIEKIKLLAKNRIMLLNSSFGLAWLLKSEQAFLTLPKESADNLRSMMRKSKKYLLECINEGVNKEKLRDDVEPEILSITIMGIINSMILIPKMKKSSKETQLCEIDKVLTGLEIMISKPTKK